MMQRRGCLQVIELMMLLVVGGMMHAVGVFSSGSSGGTELAFGYLLLAAFLGSRVITRFGLPKLTGYLLVGVASGPFVFGLISDHMAGSLRIVNDVATCILGLTAGGELNLKRVKPMMGTLRAITALGVIAAMAALAGLLFVLRPWLPMFDAMTLTQSLAVCGLLGVALSAQSPAVVMALLSETRSAGPLSRLVLATVVVADLVVVVIYSIVSAVTSAVLGGDIDVAETAMSVAWELFGSMIFGVVIGMVISLFLRHVAKGASMFALMVCVVVAEIGSQVHLDPLVVMLAAGVWLENFSRADAGKLLRGFESAELPVFLVFFALAGSRLDLFALWALIIPVGLIAATRAGVFFVGCRAACTSTHAGPVITTYAWTALVPQAGLSLALIVVIQKTFPSFGPAAAVLLLSVVAINQLIAPVVLRVGLVRSREAGKRAENSFAAEH